MKYRCQCPKPDQMKVDPYTMDVGGYVIPVLETDLHFKSADRECERCGAALCAECATTIEHEEESQFYKGLIVIVNQVVCRTCAEIANE